jgi:hypothetical protein
VKKGFTPEDERFAREVLDQNDAQIEELKGEILRAQKGPIIDTVEGPPPSDAMPDLSVEDLEKHDKRGKSLKTRYEKSTVSFYIEIMFTERITKIDTTSYVHFANIFNSEIENT